MACAYLALQRAGISVDEYIAYEIDKDAIATSTANVPIIQHCGDVFKADYSTIGNIDILMGGSPCTYWSILQHSGREVTASGAGWDLFQQYMRALHEVRPRYFIYENNHSMSDAVKQSITGAFGFEPVCINSSLVSAQNRRRYYWCGVLRNGKYEPLLSGQEPKDKGILLTDILEWGKKEKACGQPVCVAQRGRPKAVMNGKPVNKQMYEPRFDGKTNVLTTVAKDNMVLEPLYCGHCTHSAGRVDKLALGRLLKREYAVAESWDNDGLPLTGVSAVGGAGLPVVTVANGKAKLHGSWYPTKIPNGYYVVRNFTLTECKRLQTVPDGYKFPIGDTRAKKLLGNGWTVDVIAYLLGFVKADANAELDNRL